MKTNSVLFTEAGCIADGTFGHQHAREKLAKLVREQTDEIGYKATRKLLKSLSGCPIALGELNEALLGEPTDDFGEEELALDFLNLFTADGLRFQLVDGDLMLVRSDE